VSQAVAFYSWHLATLLPELLHCFICYLRFVFEILVHLYTISFAYLCIAICSLASPSIKENTVKSALKICVTEAHQQRLSLKDAALHRYIKRGI
jgi:hypothetical protein